MKKDSFLVVVRAPARGPAGAPAVSAPVPAARNRGLFNHIDDQHKSTSFSSCVRGYIIHTFNNRLFF